MMKNPKLIENEEDFGQYKRKRFDDSFEEVHEVRRANSFTENIKKENKINLTISDSEYSEPDL